MKSNRFVSLACKFFLMAWPFVCFAAIQLAKSLNFNVDGRGNFCLLKTCLPENVCKFLFHYYAFTYVALVLLVVGLR
ncbi:hypothetical protein T4D_9742 [Trichinella pseudospiralis]|uniref:Uncharacterized protein n=1 Tax=Trichinella pseudospiralis TaxID=6337 RepID=A0A0V1F4P6_TRIPS|nr:hypothetical protein T4D_9742 [Trichinella pseudospiralis]